MTNGLIAAQSFVVLSLSMVTVSHAQTACTDYKSLSKELLSHDQQPVSAGITAGGKAAFTVFASPTGSTWTMVAVGTSGQACIISAGQNWSDFAPAKGEPT